MCSLFPKIVLIYIRELNDILNATPAQLCSCIQFVKQDSGIKSCNRNRIPSSLTLPWERACV